MQVVHFHLEFIVHFNKSVEFILFFKKTGCENSKKSALYKSEG